MSATMRRCGAIRCSVPVIGSRSACRGIMGGLPLPQEADGVCPVAGGHGTTSLSCSPNCVYET